jgi:hypothetical protein
MEMMKHGGQVKDADVLHAGVPVHRAHARSASREGGLRPA